MKSNNDFDAMLDNTTAEMRNEQVDATVVSEAAGRVWARLAAEAADETAEQLRTDNPATDRIGSCADFQFEVDRSEEHTSELQSRGHLVCRLLLEKKNSDDGCDGKSSVMPVGT